MSFKRLCEAGRIGNLDIRNRMVMAAMGSGMCENDGNISERLTGFYEARAKGGIGLIVTGILLIDPTYVPPRDPGIWDDKFIPGWFRCMKRVHMQGAKIITQLMHPGRQWEYGPTQAVSASNVACRSFMYGDRPEPRALTTGEVEELVEKFAQGARRIQDAGGDGVELHGAHGYLIHQFLSPYTNKRTDKYGGNLERRIKFVVEIIERIRELCGPDFLVSMRMSAEDYVDGGNTLEDNKVIARILENQGLDCLDVSAGMHESSKERLYGGASMGMGVPPGWLVHLAEGIKSAVSIPVIAVGGLGSDLELAERVLEEGKADFVAMARSLIADPDLPMKVITGRLDEINWCIRCNECHPHDKDWLRIDELRCSVNAFAGKEGELIIAPAARPKKILVVGGGPGGMEAARVAALRGHNVTLCEKNNRLGEIILMAAKPPEKGIIEKNQFYLSNAVKRVGVKVELEVEVTPKLVEKMKPDVVILATGSIPSIPEIPGVERENVVTVNDVLLGKAKSGEKVVVIGGNGKGAEAADYLAKEGKKVTIVVRRSREVLEKDRGRGSVTRLEKEYFPDLWGVARDEGRRFRTLLMMRLRKGGVKAIFGAKIEEITDKGVTITRIDGKHLIQAHTVVLATDYKPNRELYLKLFGKVPELYLVGDCIEPRSFMEAISEGAYIGLKV